MSAENHACRANELWVSDSVGKRMMMIMEKQKKRKKRKEEECGHDLHAVTTDKALGPKADGKSPECKVSVTPEIFLSSCAN